MDTSELSAWAQKAKAAQYDTTLEITVDGIQVAAVMKALHRRHVIMVTFREVSKFPSAVEMAITKANAALAQEHRRMGRG